MEENHVNEVQILEDTIDEKQKFIENLEQKLKQLETENDRLSLREKQLMEEALFNEELIINSAESKLKQRHEDLLEKIPNPEALLAELSALRQKVKDAEQSWAESEERRNDMSAEVNSALDTLKENQKPDIVDDIIETKNDHKSTKSNTKVEPTHPSKVRVLQVIQEPLSCPILLRVVDSSDPLLSKRIGDETDS